MIALLLFCLISSPTNSSVPEWPNEMRPLLHGMGMQLEVIGHVNELGRGDTSWGHDFWLLRYWYHELHRAPRLAELHRFPDVETCIACYKANQACRECLNWHVGQLDLQMNCQGRREIFKLMKAENDELMAIWSLAQTAASPGTVFQRRCALNNLRTHLTDDEWFSGVLPLPYPSWFDGRCITLSQH